MGQIIQQGMSQFTAERVTAAAIGNQVNAGVCLHRMGEGIAVIRRVAAGLSVPFDGRGHSGRDPDDVLQAVPDDLLTLVVTARGILHQIAEVVVFQQACQR